LISYSSQDEDFARRLHADLQAKVVSRWFVPEDMRIGAEMLALVQSPILAAALSVNRRSRQQRAAALVPRR